MQLKAMEAGMSGSILRTCARGSKVSVAKTHPTVPRYSKVMKQF